MPECLQREIRATLGINVVVDAQVQTVKHAFTHFKITLHVFECRYVAGEPQALGVTAWVWVPIDQLAGYAMGKADRQIARSV